MTGGSDSASEQFQGAPEGEGGLPASDLDEQGGETSKTFTEEQVSGIVSKRVNGLTANNEAWGKLGARRERCHAAGGCRYPGYIRTGGSDELVGLGFCSREPCARNRWCSTQKWITGGPRA